MNGAALASGEVELLVSLYTAVLSNRFMSGTLNLPGHVRASRPGYGVVLTSELFRRGVNARPVRSLVRPSLYNIHSFIHARLMPHLIVVHQVEIAMRKPL